MKNTFTAAQKTLLDEFPVGVWVEGYQNPVLGTPASRLRALIRRGWLVHRQNQGMPTVILSAGKPWYQHLKHGQFMRPHATSENLQ